jgi:hypothetical protein
MGSEMLALLSVSSDFFEAQHLYSGGLCIDLVIEPRQISPPVNFGYRDSANDYVVRKTIMEWDFDKSLV